jgi:hypothetical protein
MGFEFDPAGEEGTFVYQLVGSAVLGYVLGWLTAHATKLRDNWRDGSGWAAALAAVFCTAVYIRLILVSPFTGNDLVQVGGYVALGGAAVFSFQKARKAVVTDMNRERDLNGVAESIVNAEYTYSTSNEDTKYILRKRSVEIVSRHLHINSDEARRHLTRLHRSQQLHVIACAAFDLGMEPPLSTSWRFGPSPLLSDGEGSGYSVLRARDRISRENHIQVELRTDQLDFAV